MKLYLITALLGLFGFDASALQCKVDVCYDSAGQPHCCSPVGHPNSISNMGGAQQISNTVICADVQNPSYHVRIELQPFLDSQSHSDNYLAKITYYQSDQAVQEAGKVHRSVSTSQALGKARVFLNAQSASGSVIRLASIGYGAGSIFSGLVSKASTHEALNLECGFVEDSPTAERDAYSQILAPKNLQSCLPPRVCGTGVCCHSHPPGL